MSRYCYILNNHKSKRSGTANLTLQRHVSAYQHHTGRWGHLLVFESMFGYSSRRWGGSETADLSLTPCVVFVRVQMKGCIKVLKEQPSNSVEGLLNALRCVWMCVGQRWRKRQETWRVRICKKLSDVNTSLLVTIFFFFRYTTRHLNDDSTSKQIRALLQWKDKRRELERGRKEGVHLKEEEKEEEEETNASGW